MRQTENCLGGAIKTHRVADTSAYIRMGLGAGDEVEDADVLGAGDDQVVE